MGKRTITLDDLFRIVDCRAIAADDQLETVAAIVVRHDPAADTTHRELWLGSFTEGIRPFADGAGAELVAVSANGACIAWTDTSPTGPRLNVLRGGPEAAVQRFPLPDRCTALSLNPHGVGVALSIRTPSDEGWNPDGKFYHYKSIRIKSDAEGYWDGKFAGLYVMLLAPDGTAGPLKKVDGDGIGDRLWPTWSPDGRRLAYVRSEPRDGTLANRMSLWVWDATIDERREVRGGDGPLHHPAWSPDGQTLAYAGHEDPRGGFHVPWDVWTVTLDGQRRNVTNGQQGVGDRILGDIAQSGGWSSGPVWTERGLLYIGDRRGSSHVFRVDAAGGPVETLTPSGRHTSMFAASRDGARLLVRMSTPVRLPTLERVELTRVEGVSPDRATESGALSEASSSLPGADWNQRLQDELALVEPERFTFKASDGEDIDAWIMRPPAAQGQGPRPAIMQVHGGPHACYGETFFHEFQWLVASGYTVFYCNPRGSLGYAPEFTGGIVGEWGKQDADDLLTGLRWLQAQPDVDVNALGLTGGSYGGYMTNWLIARTDAFQAAVTDRSLSNAVSFYGTSEIGPFFSDVAFGGAPWDDPEEYHRASPLSYVKDMHTPLLILHGTMDAQTPIEQAEQLYIALKSLGREAQLVIFQDANHEMSRGGRPSQRVARLQLARGWFDRYLKGAD